MTSPMDKSCISIECTWKHRCALYFKTAEATFRQYIKPEQTADGCPYFSPLRERAWGEGGESND